MKFNDTIQHNTLIWEDRIVRHELVGAGINDYTMSGKHYDLYEVPDPLVRWKGRYIENNAAVIYPIGYPGKAVLFTQQHLVNDLMYSSFYQGNIRTCIEKQGFEIARPDTDGLSGPFFPIVSTRRESLKKHHVTGIAWVWIDTDIETVKGRINKFKPIVKNKSGWPPGERLAMGFIVDKEKHYKTMAVARWNSTESRWVWEPELSIADCTAKPLPNYILILSHLGYVLSISLDLVTSPLQAIGFLILAAMGPM